MDVRTLHVATHTKLPSTLTYEKDGTPITVHFKGRAPVGQARPLVAWLVTCQLPWSPANAAATAKATLARHGTLSNAPNTLPMQRYARPSGNTGSAARLTTAGSTCRRSS